MKQQRLRIIADNAGGITLQVWQEDECLYQHCYYGGKDAIIDAAEDIRAAEEGDDVSAWDGNEMDDNLLEPTDDEIRNGGYAIYLSSKEILETDPYARGRSIDYLCDVLEKRAGMVDVLAFARALRGR